MKPTPARSKAYPSRHAPAAITKQPINLLQIMNGLSSFRSTVHDLSQSLQRLEAMMDHTTQLFSVGRNLRTGRGPFVPSLPKPPVSKDDFKDENIPIIRLPKRPPPNSPLLRLLDYVDMGKMLHLLQSPLAKNLFTNIFTPKQTEIPRIQTPRPRVGAAKRNRNRRNISRKRVRP